MAPAMPAGCSNQTGGSASKTPEGGTAPAAESNASEGGFKE